MAWIWLVLMVFSIVPIHGTNDPISDLAERRMEKAKLYIWNQINPRTGLWPRQEVNVAILGKKFKAIFLKFINET